MMYKKYVWILLFITVTAVSCNKDKIKLVNPNSPTPALSLKTESGVLNFALGIINRQLGTVVNAGVSNLKTVADVHLSLMGDELFSPYGNWGFRYSDQVYKITLPDGTVVTTPIGATQQSTLQGFNSRQAGDRNVFQYDWAFGYFYIAQANTLLQALEDPDLRFSGNAALKKAVLKAWALWWKGFAYSRIGSIYIAAVINNNTDGTTNGNYVTSQAVIAEANRNFDAAIAALNGITADAEYETLLRSITPSYNATANVITPEMWKRQINTMKARNLLVNKKVRDMTAADWAQIITLTNDGVRETDAVFMQGMTEDGNNDVVGGFYHLYNLVATAQEFVFPSERLIQDFRPGDDRLDRNFYLNPDPYPANIRSRGLQFGTRWAVTNVEDGGSFATNQNQGKLSVAGTYEENALMKAEALIYTDQVEAGLNIIDALRNFQQAGLPAVSGTGLTKAQAINELRSERRVGLIMRGLAFYDARRWGITAPAANGGGRTNAVVYLPATLAGAATDTVRHCFMEYNYMDYFDVPLTEVDFNAPKPGSAPIKN